MRKALCLLAFVLGGVVFALTVGSKAASASETLPLIGQEQTATNTNSTTQDAAAEATTKQANVNLPVSVLSWGSNGGDVDQSNSADTTAVATNENSTAQKVDQDQQADAGSRGTSHAPKSAGSGIDQDQTATNDNTTDQRSDATATTKQANVNAPISVLSWGANNGDVEQSNDADTTAKAGNSNGTDQRVYQDQQAASQGLGGGIAQSQDATNGNETTQGATADAATYQANVNVPVSVLSWGSNGGDVDQSNSADTKAYAANDNWTGQVVDQNQDAKIVAPHKPATDHGGYPKPHQPGPQPCKCDGQGPKDPGPIGHPGSIDQSQTGSNTNSTTQDAVAEATTEQGNLNLPVSILSWGANGGDVDQANYARTTAAAGNSNGTYQSVDQGQKAQVADKGSHASRPHKPRKSPHDCGCSHPKPTHGQPATITQSQEGANRNDTTQDAYADATTKQKNVNLPFSFLSWGDDKGDCGCGGYGKHGHEDGVRQRNGAETSAFAGNANRTRQTIVQAQEALIGRR
jgi:hypothetical protein